MGTVPDNSLAVSDALQTFTQGSRRRFMPMVTPAVRAGEKGPANRQGLCKIRHPKTYSVAAVATSMVTPGPMVEVSEIFFM